MPFFRKVKFPTLTVYSKAKPEAIHNIRLSPYGEVRRDLDNEPTFHGQFHQAENNLFPLRLKRPNRRQRLARGLQSELESTPEEQPSVEPPEYVPEPSPHVVLQPKMLRTKVTTEPAEYEGLFTSTPEPIRVDEQTAQKLMHVEDDNTFDKLLYDRIDESLPVDSSTKNVLKSRYFGHKLTPKLADIWSSIPSFSPKNKQDLADWLIKNILFEDDEIVVVCKPYGVGINGKGLVDQEVLSSVAKNLSSPAEMLHPVRSHHAPITGICLFARTAEKAAQLNQLFRQGQITERYWCITSNLPEPLSGEISKPLVAARVGKTGGNLRYIPSTEEDKLRSTATVYSVLTKGPKCALVECSVKVSFNHKSYVDVSHQMRSHLAFCKRSPVLGDKIYSKLDCFEHGKVVYQDLPPHIRYKLDVSNRNLHQHIPMYLHAKEIEIPSCGGSKGPLKIGSNLPIFFTKTLNFLKLTVPK